MLRLILCFAVALATFGFAGCGGTPVPTNAPPPAPPIPPPPPAQSVTGGAAAQPETGTQPSGLAPANSADGSSTESAMAPRGYQSPEAAFAAVQEAARNKDFQGAVGALTDDSQDALCGMIVLATGLMAAFGGDEMADIKAVLEKHGVPIEAPKFDFNIGEAPPADATPPAAEEPEEMPIKDKPAFIAEMFAVMEKKGGSEGFDKGPTDWIDAELRDLAIAGESATATVFRMEEGAEVTEPIEFRKGPGGWLVHLPLDLMQSQSGAEGTASAFGGDADAELQMELPVEELQAEVAATLKVYGERPFGAFFFGEYPEGALFGLMEIKGPPIAEGFAFGHFEITAAQDDTGKDLKLAVPVQDKFNKEFGAQFVELDHFFLEEKSTLPINFVLEPPGAGAQALKTLEGTLKVKVRSSIVVPDILSKVGTTLTEPKELAEAGELKIVKPAADEGQPGHVVAIDFIGDDAAVKEMGLVDANGESISTGRFSFGGGNKTHTVFESDEKLPPGTQLRISLAGTDRTVVVPFKFENAKIMSDD